MYLNSKKSKTKGRYWKSSGGKPYLRRNKDKKVDFTQAKRDWSEIFEVLEERLAI